MGGFNPITSILGAVLSPGYDAYRAADQYNHARAVYDQQEKQIKQEAARKQKQIALEAEQDETERRRALQRAQAAQQAAFGAQGIDTTDGSGEAVLMGLLRESEEDKSYRTRMDALRRTALAQETDSQRRRNLLSLQNSYAAARNGLANTFFGV